MLLNMFAPFKVYAIAVVGAIAAVFVGVYKYRGFKVDKLEEAVAVATINAIVKDEVHKSEIEAVVFESANKVSADIAEEPVTEYTPKGEIHAKDAAGTFYNI